MPARVKRWPDVPRLFRDVTLTEKLDGHTAALHIEPVRSRRIAGITELPVRPGDVFSVDEAEFTFYRVSVQNRTRLVTMHEDVAGIAAWAMENAAGIVAALGPGIHFGEWWGYKICRGYGLPPGDRRFSLFNTARWAALNGTQVPGLFSVPVLWEGSLENNWDAIGTQLDLLKSRGSVAAPGYAYPEGLVMYHHDGDTMYKVRIPEHNRKNIRQNKRR